MKINYNEIVKIEKEIEKTLMYIEFYEDHIIKARKQLTKNKIALIEQKHKLRSIYSRGDY